jgi:glycosyltransferase involved in cell wall biosynthesis
MKILHVVPSFEFGGMEKIVCTLINNTADCYAHEILSFDQHVSARKWIKDKKLPFIGFERPKGRNQFFQALHRVLQKTRPDLLMTYNWGATDAIWLGRVARIGRIIHSEHGFNADEGKGTHRKRDAIRFLVYRLASRLIVVSRELQILLQQKYFLRTNQVIRIPNGIDTSYYSPDLVERHRIREMLGLKEDSIVIGFSGRLDPIKNLDLLLKVFATCVREHPHLRLLLVGDGPEKGHLEALCQERNIRSYVVFAGQQENVLPYLRAMDMFLLTSFREQMPLTVLEAMAVKVPIVSTRVGEIPHVIDDGVNGFIHEMDAPIETFVQSLFVLLSPTRRVSMGEAARQKVVEGFQEQGMVQQYKTLIQAL